MTTLRKIIYAFRHYPHWSLHFVYFVAGLFFAYGAIERGRLSVALAVLFFTTVLPLGLVLGYPALEDQIEVELRKNG